MLELHIAETEVQSGTVRVSWCVSQKVLDALALVRCTEPQLLLITIPSEGWGSRLQERRKIVPLSDLMTYVDFRSAGENRLYGIVLYKGTPKEMRNIWLRYDGNSYNRDALTDDGEDVLPMQLDAVPLTASVNVVVPKECFAKEPSAWEKRWVNRWHQGPAKDQCQFNRRRIMAYTLKPIGFVLWKLFLIALMYAVTWIVGVVTVLCALRGFRWRLLFWPLPGYSMSDFELFHDYKGSWFFPKTKRTWARLILLPFMPAFPAAGFLLLKLCFKWKLKASLFVLVAVALGTVGAIVVVASVALAYPRLAAALRKLTATRSEEEKRPILPYLHDPLLTCRPDRPMRVQDLPRGRRTFRLRLADFKARSCRPFSA